MSEKRESPRALLLLRRPPRLATPHLVTTRHDAPRVAGISPSRAYLFAVWEINCVINFESLTDALLSRFAFRFFWIVAVPTRTWAAPHDLPEPHYISADENPSLYVPHMRLPVSSSLRRRLRLPHPVRRRAPTAGTVGLRNPASREPVRVRGNQVFGERSGATTGSTTSSSDDEFLHTDNFFPDLSDFFDNLNMGDNDAAVKYVILSFLFQFMLELLVLVSVVDAIGLSCLDVICSSTLLVCTISLLIVFIVMIYQLLVRIISYGYLLIYSTIQKPDYRQINSSSIAAATRPPSFDGMHYKRWRTKAVLWFTNLGCFSATDARPEGPLSAEEQEKFEKVDAMFKAALFSILGDNIVDPYMAFDHGKDAWDALEAKFGVSDAGTELYVMEQYYDYRMTDERSVVE